MTLSEKQEIEFNAVIIYAVTTMPKVDSETKEALVSSVSHYFIGQYNLKEENASFDMRTKVRNAIWTLLNPQS